MTDITQQVKNLWKMLYTSGIGNALRGLNVLSYLFVLREFEERAKLRSTDGSFGCSIPEAYRWSVLKNTALHDGEACSRSLRSAGVWLQALDPESCLAETVTPYTLLLLAPEWIGRVMDAIDALCSGETPVSEIFEEVLVSAALEGAFSQAAGQVMTPRHIALLMADLLRPRQGERVIDISCGCGNLLLSAWEHAQSRELSARALLADGRFLGLQERCPSGLTLLGCDYSPEMLPSCYTHLLLVGVDRPRIWCSDALGQAFNQRMLAGGLGEVDVILGNPPYNGFRDSCDRGETLNWLKTDQTELLFVDLTLQLLREGGRAALLLPEGVYRNTSKAAQTVRKKLITQNQLHAVVSLPSGIFLPHANISTSLVLLTKGGCTAKDVWFYRVSQDGFSFNAQRQSLPAHTDLWDLRCQHAATFGLEPPHQVAGLQSTEWWEEYTSCQTNTVYVTPVIDENALQQSCEMKYEGQRITGFTVDQSLVERAWFVSPEDIAAQGYSLCADTYRQKEGQSRASTRRTPR